MNEIIKARRKELNITLEEIGDYVGVSKTTVQRWESGNISNMRRDRIKKLSEILRLDPQIFIGEETVPSASFAKVPVIGRVAAGVPVTAQEDILGYEEIPSEWVKNDNIFALKIKGDSMEPRIMDGDIVIVRQQQDIDSGEIAVVMTDNEAVCKKVIKHAEDIVLVSNNTKYEPMVFTKKDVELKKLVILGKVIELRAKF